ncbi:hypothetical protein KQX54_004511 [Cotesia glomerata]|uniref:Uncharacterized protein n=1 Tax=Cotesia glomerata TaxID=32391 RepID=A0AAV7J488_COTGL|nr:hypothetical protein KQX54_004511 [Cotesia glomerata]
MEYSPRRSHKSKRLVCPIPITARPSSCSGMNVNISVWYIVVCRGGRDKTQDSRLECTIWYSYKSFSLYTTGSSTKPLIIPNIVRVPPYSGCVTIVGTLFAATILSLSSLPHQTQQILARIETDRDTDTPKTDNS